jgi:hypothetical protein
MNCSTNNWKEKLRALHNEEISDLYRSLGTVETVPRITYMFRRGRHEMHKEY